jgi:RecQ-mediated genome instability protein 1
MNAGNTFQDRSAETVVEEHVSPPVVVNTVREQIQHVQEINMEDLSTSHTANHTDTSPHTNHEYDHTRIIERRSTHTIIEECADPPIRANNAHEQIQHVPEITMQEQATAFGPTERTSVSTLFGCDSQRDSHVIEVTTANDVEAARSTNVDRINQMEHSFILNGENEKPFTYLCNMFSDWGTQQDTKAYIQGKIKVHLFLATLQFICKLRNLSVPF